MDAAKQRIGQRGSQIRPEEASALIAVQLFSGWNYSKYLLQSISLAIIPVNRTKLHLGKSFLDQIIPETACQTMAHLAIMRRYAVRMPWKAIPNRFWSFEMQMASKIMHYPPGHKISG
jgi:hypothetical protein